MPEFGEKEVIRYKTMDHYNFHQKLLKEGLTTKYISSVDVMLNKSSIKE